MWISKFRTAAGMYKLTDADCDLESKIKKDKTVYLRGLFEMLPLWKRKLKLTYWRKVTRFEKTDFIYTSLTTYAVNMYQFRTVIP